MELGAPPRVITPVLAAYLAAAVPSLVPVCLGVAIVLGFVVAAPVGPLVTRVAAGGEVALVVAAVALYLRGEAQRRPLRWLLERGSVRAARVIAVDDLAPDSSRTSYRVTFEVDGQTVSLRGSDPRLGRLGDAPDVLWDASRPRAIIPLALLAAR